MLRQAFLSLENSQDLLWWLCIAPFLVGELIYTGDGRTIVLCIARDLEHNRTGASRSILKTPSKIREINQIKQAD